MGDTSIVYGFVSQLITGGGGSFGYFVCTVKVCWRLGKARARVSPLLFPSNISRRMRRGMKLAVFGIRKNNGGEHFHTVMALYQL